MCLYDWKCMHKCARVCLHLCALARTTEAVKAACHRSRPLFSLLVTRWRVIWALFHLSIGSHSWCTMGMWILVSHFEKFCRFYVDGFSAAFCCRSCYKISRAIRKRFMHACFYAETVLHHIETPIEITVVGNFIADIQASNELIWRYWNNKNIDCFAMIHSETI